MSYPLIYPSGDHAITVAWPPAIDAALHREVMGLAQWIRDTPPEGLKDIVPAYHTLTLVYDIAALRKKYPSAYDHMHQYLVEAIAQATGVNEAIRHIDIPVCYDPSLAPDLVSLAATHSLDVEEVVRLHTSREYRVYMLGFLPGFAYMGSVNERIRTPRKPTPSGHVPAGSVAIAGEQTGIYPFESPGGWQLIGRTPLVMFDARRGKPSLLHPGDIVHFHSISIHEFNQTRQA